MNIRRIGVAPLTGVEARLPAWSVTPAPPINGETCDVCGAHLPAMEIFFDGELFLCPTCRQFKSQGLKG